MIFKFPEQSKVKGRFWEKTGKNASAYYAWGWELIHFYYF
jgi:hypothetical protein